MISALDMRISGARSVGPRPSTLALVVRRATSCMAASHSATIGQPEESSTFTPSTISVEPVTSATATA